MGYKFIQVILRPSEAGKTVPIYRDPLVQILQSHRGDRKFKDL